MTLRGLIEAVEAGMDPGLYYHVPQSLADHAETICAAHYGSLDAAKRLHDALLPGWRFLLRNTTQEDIDRGECKEGESGFANVWRRESPNNGGPYFYAFSADSARAWLLAILRALDADHREGGE